MNELRAAIAFLSKEIRLADLKGHVARARRLRIEMCEKFQFRHIKPRFDAYDFVSGNESGTIFNFL